MTALSHTKRRYLPAQHVRRPCGCREPFCLPWARSTRRRWTLPVIDSCWCGRGRGGASVGAGRASACPATTLYPVLHMVMPFGGATRYVAGWDGPRHRRVHRRRRGQTYRPFRYKYVCHARGPWAVGVGRGALDAWCLVRGDTCYLVLTCVCTAVHMLSQAKQTSVSAQPHQHICRTIQATRTCPSADCLLHCPLAPPLARPSTVGMHAI